jgi:hypothetical protein
LLGDAAVREEDLFFATQVSRTSLDASNKQAQKPHRRAEKYMIRTVRSKLLLSVLGLAVWPMYGQDPAAAPPATMQSTPIQANADAKPPTNASKQDNETADASKKDHDNPLPAAKVHNPILWEDPGNIAGRNLFFGQGGEKHQPKAPFTFESEDKNGSNPKFDVRDVEGKKWRVKLGEEARPEVVASRLLWAVGYYANDDYLLHVASVKNLELKRGGDQVKNGKTGNGQVIDSRFSRKPGGQEKIAIWKWKENPFAGTREFNGLRVMMAVMNNWDLKDENNSVYYDKKTDRQVFLINDVGATFGANGLGFSRARSKGNIDSFKGSKFITRSTDTEVDFATPKAPAGVLIASFGFSAKQYASRAGLDWIGNNIPRADARWMGSLLSQLTHEQLTDAFRAGNFPADQIDAYVEIIESRIQELKHL